MTLLVPDVGESLALQNFLNKTAPQDQSFRLYKNNITPAETDTDATYTDADFTGYVAAALTGANWSIAGTAPTSASYAQQTFTSSADQTAQSVYGYRTRQTTSTTLMWAERFTNGPYVIANNGDAVKVTPTITMD